jgi:glycosyltransferase involved in cell wall biosynthesis
MPCFNVASFIGEAIESIIAQSHTDWELIIIDDASTDETKQIINSYTDKRIRMINLPTNVGNYAARNIGIKECKGKYIAMADADDVYQTDRIKLQYDYLESHEEIGGIGSNYYIMDEEGKIIREMKRACDNEDLKLHLLIDNYLLQSTLFVRKELLKKYSIRYDTKFHYASDYHFVFQCIKNFKIINIEKNLTNYRINKNGITSTKKIEQQSYASEIREQIIKFYFSSHLKNEQIVIFCSFLSPSFTTMSYNLTHLIACIQNAIDCNEKNKYFKQNMFINLLNNRLFYLFRNRSVFDFQSIT